MKQYKLIKEYPESPRLGTIIERRKGTNMYFYNYKQICHPENYPEFWEEIVERDFEILSSKLSLQHKKYKVHSIKRLSDGEIFTVGDKIKTEFGGYCVIDGFRFSDGKLIIDHTDSYLLNKKYPKTEYGHHLHLIEKPKKPIFITEDGVQCFDDHYNLFSVLTKGSWETKRTLPSQAENYSSWKHFHTKEARDEYILNNKPVLSLNDIYDICEEIGLDGIIEIEEFEIEKLVKSKL